MFIWVINFFNEYNGIYFNEDVVLGLLSQVLLRKEKDFLGLEGNEAFSLDNSDNLSKFNS
jgi:hypothetical protein